jgi:succinate dehydrogenase / fumarate reductase cytochrome b subunit
MPMPDEFRSNTSPVFFDLYRIKFPVTAVVSMGHRVSGVLLALCVPVLVYLLQLSLSGSDGYARAGALFQHPAIGAATVVLIWALAHHVLAGVRHLLFDIHVGTALRAARISAWLVLAVELAIVMLAIRVIL